MKEIVLLSFGIGLGFYIKTLRDKNKANEEAERVRAAAARPVV